MFAFVSNDECITTDIYFNCILYRTLILAAILAAILNFSNNRILFMYFKGKFLKTMNTNISMFVYHTRLTYVVIICNFDGHLGGHLVFLKSIYPIDVF